MLFTIKGHEVEPTPQTLTIPEFKKIWDKDKTETKTKARAQLAFVYHLVDPKSTYVNSSHREQEVATDFLNGARITKDLTTAVEKYRQLITTPEQRLLEGSLNAADRLADYFNTINFTLTDDSGALIHDPHKVMASLQKVNGVIKSLQDLRELMEKGAEEQEANRGGAELNMFDRD